MRRPSFKVLFWLWPIAYLVVIPFAIATAEYLRPRAPVAARLGAAFLLIYTVLWFPFNAVFLSAITAAQSDPLQEVELGLLLTVVGNLASSLFWAIALFEGVWATVLLKEKGTDLLAGWAFALGIAATVTYFVIRYTGPYRPAEIVHTLLIVCMVLGIGSLAFSMAQSSRNLGQE
jgi:hypothetical protein